MISALSLTLIVLDITKIQSNYNLFYHYFIALKHQNTVIEL